MRRAQAHAGRSAVVLVLSVLMVVAGVVGLRAQAPEPTGPASGHHTTDLDLTLGLPAAHPQRVGHVLRLDGPAPAWVPTGADPVGPSVAQDVATMAVQPLAEADRSDLGGRAPPA